MGHAYLQWALSEAAVLFLREHPQGQKYLARLEKKHGRGKALTVLAHKFARAVSYMLHRGTAFDRDTLLHEEGSGVSEPVAELDKHGMSPPRALCKTGLRASMNAEERVGMAP